MIFPEGERVINFQVLLLDCCTLDYPTKPPKCENSRTYELKMK